MSYAAPKLPVTHIITAQSDGPPGLLWESSEEHRGWTQSCWWELSREGMAGLTFEG